MHHRNHQPLQPTAILLNHMARCPADPANPHYRRILDIAFAFMGQDGGIIADDSGRHVRPLTDGGSEAWDYLRRLRSRVWRRDGLEPGAVMSRTEAAVLCREMSVRSASSEEVHATSMPAQISTQAGAAGMDFAWDPSLDFLGSPLGPDWDLYIDENFPPEPGAGRSDYRQL